MRSGQIDKPVIFHVDPIRDGGSFSTRRVVAQQGSKAIFNASLSFKEFEEGIEGQLEMHEIPTPYELPSDKQRRMANGQSKGFPGPEGNPAFEFRTVGALPDEYVKGMDAKQGFWLKTAHSAPICSIMQHSLLAYISDVRLMLSPLIPLGAPIAKSNFQLASLDHAIWFHRPFNITDWLYYDMAGPTASDGRGLSFGRFYDVNGRLVASSAQEGLIRRR